MAKRKKKRSKKRQSFEQILRDIKSVKIQGASNVAKAGLKALLLKHDTKSIKKIISVRPTEPLLRNMIKFALSFPNVKEGVKHALSYFPKTEKIISGYGKRIIKNNSVVCTHCHSTNVVKLLIKARKSGKKFKVYLTETRPLYQGRRTALELAKAGIKVFYLTDLQARIGLKKSDIFLFGADTINADKKIANKVGTELFVDLAKQYGKRVYCVTQALKFDPETLTHKMKRKLEVRSGKEVWDIKNKNITIINNAFEFVDAKKIDGIVTEFGTKKINSFIKAFKKHYGFLISKRR